MWTRKILVVLCSIFGAGKRKMCSKTNWDKICKKVHFPGINKIVLYFHDAIWRQKYLLNRKYLGPRDEECKTKSESKTKWNMTLIRNIQMSKASLISDNLRMWINESWVQLLRVVSHLIRGQIKLCGALHRNESISMSSISRIVPILSSDLEWWLAIGGRTQVFFSLFCTQICVYRNDSSVTRALL